jgi:hypothetical protein
MLKCYPVNHCWASLNTLLDYVKWQHFFSQYLSLYYLLLVLLNDIN